MGRRMQRIVVLVAVLLWCGVEGWGGRLGLLDVGPFLVKRRGLERRRSCVYVGYVCRRMVSLPNVPLCIRCV